MRRRLPPLALASLLGLAGCVTFVDPSLPKPGAALLTATVRLLSPHQASLEADLRPGLDAAHEFRAVPDDTIMVLGQPVAPTTTYRSGERSYNATLETDSIPAVVTLTGPAVAEVEASPPSLRWYTVQKLDPDTIRAPAGGDVIFHVAPPPPGSTPEPTVRTWQLELRGPAHSIRIGGDGLPPEEIRVPSQFVPAAEGDQVFVTLQLFESVSLILSPGDYQALLGLDERLHWTVLVTPGAGGAS